MKEEALKEAALGLNKSQFYTDRSRRGTSLTGPGADALAIAVPWHSPWNL